MALSAARSGTAEARAVTRTEAASRFIDFSPVFGRYPTRSEH
jgi:hypothetical protein